MDLQVLMADWSYKSKSDLIVGDKIMGPDYQPRTVVHTETKEGPMYKVEAWHSNPFKIGADCKLTITHKKTGEKRSVVVQDFAIEPDYFNNKYQLYGDSSVDLPEQPVPIDPYIFGVWLACGDRTGDIVFQTKKPIIIEKLVVFAARNDMSFTRSGRKNSIACHLYDFGEYNIRAKLTALNVLTEKHIPFVYINNSRHVRSQVLNGMFDCFIFQDNKKMRNFHIRHHDVAEIVAILCKTLGMNIHHNFCSSNGRVVIGVLTKYDPLSPPPMEFGIKRITKVESDIHKAIQIDSDGQYLSMDFMIMEHDGDIASTDKPAAKRQLIEYGNNADVTFVNPLKMIL
jgi:hypothetical protein